MLIWSKSHVFILSIECYIGDYVNRLDEKVLLSNIEKRGLVIYIFQNFSSTLQGHESRKRVYVRTIVHAHRVKIINYNMVYNIDNIRHHAYIYKRTRIHI